MNKQRSFLLSLLSYYIIKTYLHLVLIYQKVFDFNIQDIMNAPYDSSGWKTTHYEKGKRREYKLNTI